MKAEAVKLPGAGISPKPCPRKMHGRKRPRAALSKNRNEEQTRVSNSWKKQSRALWSLPS